jgi:hypothetical protein
VDRLVASFRVLAALNCTYRKVHHGAPLAYLVLKNPSQT